MASATAFAIWRRTPRFRPNCATIPSSSPRRRRKSCDGIASSSRSDASAGDTIALYLAGAGVDRAAFPAPERFDLERENKAHIAFGAGPHRCIGSHLARIELHAVYAVVLEKLPTFRLDPEKPARFHAGNILAMASLPIRWD